MLTCRTLDVQAVLNQTVDLSTTKADPFFLQILQNIAVCGLIGKRTECSRTEDVTLTEKLLCIFVHASLNVA